MFIYDNVVAIRVKSAEKVGLQFLQKDNVFFYITFSNT